MKLRITPECFNNIFALSPVIFFKKRFLFIFSDHSVHVAYLGFHMLLGFEQQVFLPLDYVFSYYKKDAQRNQNKIIIRRNFVFCFSRLNVL